MVARGNEAAGASPYYKRHQKFVVKKGASTQNAAEGPSRTVTLSLPWHLCKGEALPIFQGLGSHVNLRVRASGRLLPT